MRLKYLDVLKAFAIISVVLYHSGFMDYGYLGVDIFLVINGFLITKSLNKRIIETPSPIVSTYFSFEISRIARLLPVLLVAGLLCMAIGYFAMLPDDYENLGESVVATNVFGNNILAAITTKNYWDVVNEYKPLMHTWYVGVVMQFYIIYPIIFLFAQLDKKHTQRTLLTIISTLALASLLTYFGTEEVAPRFYYLPARFFEFAVGGIVALTWKPQNDSQPFHKWYVYACYALLIVLVTLNQNSFAAIIKLVMVVALAVVLIMSGTVLENKVTANAVLAKMGAASYSIFVWHQVLLAFYRYTFSSSFSFVSYIMILTAVAIFSWLTYRLIEQNTNIWLKERKSKTIFYIVTLVIWLGLSIFAGYIYIRGGVVRDVPELYISKEEKTDHRTYNDKIYQLDKPFESGKKHWLVVGSSFGRDFSNVILESPISDSVEVSYIYSTDFEKTENAERFAKSDRVFFSVTKPEREIVREIENVCLANGVPLEKLIIVGTKNFGESNGQIYVKRNLPEYFNLRVKMKNGFFENNEKYKELYGERYLDLIGLVIDENLTVPVFSPDHHYISQDCDHLSKGGAIFFGQLIDWTRFMN